MSTYKHLLELLLLFCVELLSRFRVEHGRLFCSESVFCRDSSAAS